MYLSPEIQNEIIYIIGDRIKNYILQKVIEYGSFFILTDETSDLSLKELVSVFIRYVRFENNIRFVNA